ncbi:unnamed protein product [Paramecium sonneborni]|uniref:Uncharacterized protein n=1 Tax=Paramecium sonneborni TaxID=65129 RepID=A0A8S1RGQ0_9CILI|nr:unnamed protein product [Paramecium sonneborni]
MTKILKRQKKNLLTNKIQQDLFKTRLLEKDDILYEAKNQFEKYLLIVFKINGKCQSQYNYQYFSIHKLLKQMRFSKIKSKKSLILNSKSKNWNPNCQKPINNISNHQNILNNQILNLKNLFKRIQNYRNNSYSKMKNYKILNNFNKEYFKTILIQKVNQSLYYKLIQKLKLIKDQEIELIKEQQKSLATQLKTSQGYATRFKQITRNGQY